MMRLFGAVVTIAGMVWMMVGCGSAVAPLVSRGVALADSVTGWSDGEKAFAGCNERGADADDC